MDELWRSTEWPGYQVSNLGNVKGPSGKVLKGRLNKSGHLQINISGVGNKHVHRLVALAFVPNPDGAPCVDHIDRDPTNNAATNLRWVSKSQNGMNRGLQANNTTGFKGVSRFRDKFQAGIKINGKRIHLGFFKTAEEAFEAYKVACVVHHGIFGHVEHQIN